MGAPTSIQRPAGGWPIRRITTHPGVMLREDFLVPMGITAHQLSLHIRVPATRISEVIHGRRSVTSDTALRLARFLGNSPEFWMNIQVSYDLTKARRASGEKIEEEVEPYVAAIALA